MRKSPRRRPFISHFLIQESADELLRQLEAASRTGRVHEGKLASMLRKGQIDQRTFTWMKQKLIQQGLLYTPEHHANPSRS